MWVVISAVHWLVDMNAPGPKSPGSLEAQGNGQSFHLRLVLYDSIHQSIMRLIMPAQDQQTVISTHRGPRTAMVQWLDAFRHGVLALLAADDDGAVGMVNHEVGHTAHNCTSYLAEPSGPHHDHCGLLFIRHTHNDLARFSTSFRTDRPRNLLEEKNHNCNTIQYNTIQCNAMQYYTPPNKNIIGGSRGGVRGLTPLRGFFVSMKIPTDLPFGGRCPPPPPQEFLPWTPPRRIHRSTPWI